MVAVVITTGALSGAVLGPRLLALARREPERLETLRRDCERVGVPLLVGCLLCLALASHSAGVVLCMVVLAALPALWRSLRPAPMAGNPPFGPASLVGCGLVLLAAAFVWFLFVGGLMVAWLASARLDRQDLRRAFWPRFAAALAVCLLAGELMRS